jgi:AcrR family transcriptional regulator
VTPSAASPATGAGERAGKPHGGGAASARRQPIENPKDEARTLALLWKTHQKMGRSGLTLSAIVGAAVKIADEEGLDAVSMRRLAEVLDVGTMSLYTHVPGKAELTDLMVDAVYGELYASVDEPESQPGSYRDRLLFVAGRNRSLYARHPWLLDVPLGRPVLGPHAVTKYEAELRVLDGIGLSPPEMDSIEALLVMHVQSTSRVRASHQRAQRLDGMTEVEWWTSVVPLLQRVRTGQFPVAARVSKAAGQAMAPGPSDEHLYRVGLEMLCDSVAALIARHQKK